MGPLLFVLPFAGALAVVAAGLFRVSWSRPVALAVLAAETATAVVALIRTLADGPQIADLGGWPAPLGIHWSLGPLSAGMILLVAASSLLGLAASRESVAAELRGRERSFHACALLLVSGLVGMCATNDLFNFFVHLEVASLSAYALTASGGPGACRAALRYLVTGSLGAGLYLLGVGHLYAATGSLSLTDVASRVPAVAEPGLVSLAGVFIAVGLSVKMGLFPLHAWMPEAYARCSGPAAVLMAPTVTKVAAFSLVRLLLGILGLEGLRREEMLSAALQWGGAAAAVAGAVLASRAAGLRRLLAYSSVSQVGLVAMGLGMATLPAVTGAVLQIGADAAAKAVLFTAAMLVARRFGIDRVDRLAEIRGRAPWISAAVAIAALSLVGLPPLPGFFGKWYLLGEALEQGKPALAAAVAVSTLGAAVYAFRILERLLVGTAPAAEEKEGPWSGVAATAALALLAAGLGLAAGPIAALVAKSGLGGGA